MTVTASVVLLYVFLCFQIFQSALVVDNSPQIPTTTVSAVDETFFACARSGDVKKLESYIENDPSIVQARDAKGNSALIIAAGRGQISVIKLLLTYRANVEDTTQHGLFEGKSALSWAASQGRADAVAVLLQAGANPHRTAEIGVFWGKGPLMWASSQGRTEVLRLLLIAGVDVNHSSNEGNFKRKTCLMWASSQGRVDTVAVLLEAGADVNAVDDDEVSALMWASGSEVKDEKDHKQGLLEKARKGNKEVVSLLLKYGASPDMRDRDGITAIMYACFHGHAGAVKALLNAGADADFKNRAGLTAMQLAKKEGFIDAANAIAEGPDMFTLPLSELLQVSTCGWVLSVLRAPRSTGIYPVKTTTKIVPSTATSTPVHAHPPANGGTSTGQGTATTTTTNHHGAGESHSPSITAETTTTSSSLNGDRTIEGANPYTIANSCGVLIENGLDDTLLDLLMIVDQAISAKSGVRSNGKGMRSNEMGRSGRSSDGHVSEGIMEGITEVVAHLGVYQFAAKIRATDQLRRLYVAWKAGRGYDDEGKISNQEVEDGSIFTPLSSPTQSSKISEQNGTKNDRNPNNNNNNNNNSHNHSHNHNHSNPILTNSCTQPSFDILDSSVSSSSIPGFCSVCDSLMTMMERYCLNIPSY